MNPHKKRQEEQGGLVECLQCGTCCVAPDIRTLEKPLGVRCRHLGEDNRCAAYADRPAVCRGYRPDELCQLIAAPTLDERVDNYLSIFGLTGQISGSSSGQGHRPAIRHRSTG